MLDEKQRCSVRDTDEPTEFRDTGEHTESPVKLPRLSRGEIAAKQQNYAAMDIDLLDTDPVHTVCVLRPVRSIGDNLLVEYTSESLGYALSFIRNAGFYDASAETNVDELKAKKRLLQHAERQVRSSVLEAGRAYKI